MDDTYYVFAVVWSGARGGLGLPRHRTRSGTGRDVARLADQPIHSGASGSGGRDILPRDFWRTLSSARTGAVPGRCRAGAGGILVGWLASKQEFERAPNFPPRSPRRVSRRRSRRSLGALSPVSPVELRQRDYPQPQGLPEVPLPLPAGRPGAAGDAPRRGELRRRRREPATVRPIRIR